LFVGISGSGRSDELEFKYEVRVRRIGNQVVQAGGFQARGELGISPIGIAAEGPRK